MCSYWELGLAALAGIVVLGIVVLWLTNRIIIPWR
jgi:hypothetical protein